MFWNPLIVLVFIGSTFCHIQIGREILTERKDTIINKLKEKGGDDSALFSKIFSKSLEGLNWKKEKKYRNSKLTKSKDNNDKSELFSREKKINRDSLHDEYIKSFIKKNNDDDIDIDSTTDKGMNPTNQQAAEEEYANLSTEGANQRGKVEEYAFQLAKAAESNENADITNSINQEPDEGLDEEGNKQKLGKGKHDNPFLDLTKQEFDSNYEKMKKANQQKVDNDDYVKPLLRPTNEKLDEDNEKSEFKEKHQRHRGTSSMEKKDKEIDTDDQYVDGKNIANYSEERKTQDTDFVENEDLSTQNLNENLTREINELLEWM